MGLADFITKTLTTRVAPMVYIMMFVNVLIGLFFTTGLFMAGNESILYSTGVLVNRQIWGVILLTTSTIALYGMSMDKPWAVKLGGIAGFCVWMFASIALALGGHIYVLVTIALFHLLFHGYVYLATATNVLHRESIY